MNSYLHRRESVRRIWISQTFVPVVIATSYFHIEQVMGNVVIWQHLLCYKKVNKKKIFENKNQYIKYITNTVTEKGTKAGGDK